MKSSGTRRQRGAYFTPQWLAEELATWAVKLPGDIVVDPAAGTGDLLFPCLKRLLKIGGNGRGQIYGVEIHGPTWRRLSRRFEGSIRASQLLCGDFFSRFRSLPPADVVIANPPYVRHQLIGEASRRRMQAGANGRKAKLDGKASAWAYFVATAPELLKPGGRLVMVLPSEVLSATYSVALVEELGRLFAKVQLIYCDDALFDDLSQRTVLCLAEGYGRSSRTPQIQYGRAKVLYTGPARRLDLTSWPQRPPTSRHSVARMIAPDEAIELEGLVSLRTDVVTVGELARVSIGYVTGANDFFHLTEGQRKHFEIPVRHLRKVLAGSKWFDGLQLADGDWDTIRFSGGSCWLFAPMESSDRSVANAIARGRRRGIHETFKCGARSPWWRVSLREPPKAFMRYMGDGIGIVANPAGVLVSNSLFELRELRGIDAKSFSAISLTSVCRISAFLNARILGGGLRKLEPRDAARVLLPRAKVSAYVTDRLDAFLREGRRSEARQLADAEILGKSLGWPTRLVARLQRALATITEEE
jgi:adenine-specific DNA-methyltransferase